MKIEYEFTYGIMDASATFIVDTEKFKPESAKDLLEFFSWDYDENADPIEEILKKYAIRAIMLASYENYSIQGVQDWFFDQEGFLPIDGSQGVLLTNLMEYEFDEDAFTLIKTPKP